jgi:hypothetical protein
MLVVVVIDPFDGIEDVFHRLKREQAFAGG